MPPKRSGTSVTLTAVASGGSTFVGWSGAGCTGQGTCTVSMSAAQNVSAQFDTTPTQYQLTVAKSGTGSGTVVFKILCPRTWIFDCDLIPGEQKACW